MQAEGLADKAPTIASLRNPPYQSLSGDVVLKLDGNLSITAHSAYLEHASEVFQNVLGECSQRHTAAKKRRTAHQADGQQCATSPRELPMPGAGMHQALLLLHCLYAFDRRSWLAALSPSDLLDLASITHRYACTSILDLVHTVLVQRCSAGAPSTPVLTISNAPEQLQVAKKLQLTGYEACIGRFLGTHAADIDMRKLDVCLANALQATVASRAELLDGMFASR